MDEVENIGMPDRHHADVGPTPKSPLLDCTGFLQEDSHETDNITLAILPSYLNGLERNATVFLAGTERAAWMVCLHTIVQWASFAEEPDVGGPQVRFREGQECCWYMEEILWHHRESRWKTENTNFFLSSRSLLPTRPDHIKEH
ncbi:MAG: hypothetical protein P8Z79_03220 [Sedimentisphaerales bacterium]